MQITKENYQDLIWNKDISFDAYDNFVGNLGNDETVTFLKFILEKFPDYDDQWIEYFFEVMGTWEENGAWEKLADFTDFLREKSPVAYQKSFGYLDTIPVLHAFFTDDLAIGKERFQQTVQQPMDAVDDCLPAVFNLLSMDRKFQNYSKEVAQKVWKPLRDSEKLLGGTEFEYSLFLYCDYLEKAFDKIKNGETIDWAEFTEKVTAIDFEFIESLTLLSDISPTVNWGQFNKEPDYRNERLLDIGLDFFYRAYHDYGVPVYWAYRGFYDFVEECLNQEDATKRKEWLLFTPAMIDRMGGSLIGFFGNNITGMMGVMWVIPYLYDYFLKLNYITEDNYATMMQYYQFSRREGLRIGGNKLWTYAGFYTWQKPNFISAEDFNQEKLLVENTINQSKVQAEEAIADYVKTLSKLPKTATPKPKENPLFKRMMGNSYHDFDEEGLMNVMNYPPVETIKNTKKIGRNEKVTVKYTDGTVKKQVKYKKVSKDLDAGKCELVD